MHNVVRREEIVKSVWKGSYYGKEAVFKDIGHHYDADHETKILEILKDCDQCVKLIARTRDSVVINYFTNGDLFNYLMSKGGKLPLEEACYITYHICKAAIQIHTKNVYHLDLKLENICLDEKMIPCIIDFANSQIMNNDPIDSFSATHTYISPEYGPLYQEMISSIESPQSILKKRKITKDKIVNIDTWSIGIIFFVLLFGCFPFGNQNCVNRMLRMDYSFPTKIPENLEMLIRSILVADGNARPNLEVICLILETYIDIE